jgi:sterol desaturase/sphingolipid hydroxylase (fatty acid hydroxylase superfamily)
MVLRFWVYALVVVVLSAGSLRLGTITPPEAATSCAAGLLLWTVLEYLMHRFAFHGFAPHYEHHREPANPTYILAPWRLSLGGGGLVWLLLRAITGSGTQASLVTAGVLTGFLGYELLHLRIHSRHKGGRLLRALRKYHFHHHFADDRVCYGVTSPVWDVVFGSLPQRRRVRSEA